MNLFSAFKIKRRNKESITVKELLSQIDSGIIAKDILRILKEDEEFDFFVGEEHYENTLNKFINDTDLLIYNIEKIRDIIYENNNYNTNNYILKLSSLTAPVIYLENLSPYYTQSKTNAKSILFILNVKIDIDVYKELTRNEVLAYIFLDYLLE
ncbi:hypothetical protein FDG11_11185 [Clostridium botulinum]|nr:hypothetical protein [Clostridium botulinum]NFP21793.1 hypothetical protein [Clostridium botulinum]NFS32959.1 hypothetical protein [Clostridium botulinum]NFU37930.1 hypothetical protein [Clostridium botulinum]NFU91494.1 hypothetical protein [Clostridium botulinum]